VSVERPQYILSASFSQYSCAHWKFRPNFFSQWRTRSFASSSSKFHLVPPKLELFTRAVQFAQQERIAVITNGKQYTYDDLLQDSFHIASILSARDLQEERVAFLMPANYQYVKTQWAIWLAGGIAVPLSPLHPPAEWEYFIRDSESSIVVTSSEYSKDIAPVAQKLNRRLVTLNANKTFTDTQPHFNTSLREFVDIEPHRGAQIIYTSGTTSRPKGVLSTHANVSAQVRTLVHSWEWSAKDHILNVLPLHHIHGIINVVTCALWSGAKLEMMENFDARKVWDVFIRDSVKQRGLVSSFLRSSPQGVTLFMAVPPIYSRLIKEYETMSAAEQKAATEACRRLRLMVSGSMALPQSVFRRWEEISGHQLLERYGMTEIGMALSNPIRGPRLPVCSCVITFFYMETQLFDGVFTPYSRLKLLCCHCIRAEWGLLCQMFKSKFSPLILPRRMIRKRLLLENFSLKGPRSSENIGVVQKKRKRPLMRRAGLKLAILSNIMREHTEFLGAPPLIF